MKNTKKYNFYLFIFAVLALFFGFFSCEEEFTSPVPYANVYIDLDLNGRDLDLSAAGSVKCITRPRLETERLGYGGILVTNGFFGSNEFNLYAYDLSCPVEAAARVVRVVPDEVGQAECPVCKTVYNISDGNGFPVSGTSKYPLKSYRIYSGTAYRRYVIRN